MVPYISPAIIKGSLMDPKASRIAEPPHRKCILELDLAQCRKRAGVSLEDIVQRTKISSRFLRAIEEEQFDQLPGGIFSTSYLRQYAVAIGYDEEALVAHYIQKVDPPAPARKPVPRETGKAGLLDRWFGVAAQAPR